MKSPRSSGALQFPHGGRNQLALTVVWIAAHIIRPIGARLRRVSPVQFIMLATVAGVLAICGLVAQLLVTGYHDAIAQAERKTQDFVDLLAEHTRLTFDDAGRTIEVALESREKLIAEGAWWPVISERPYEMLRSLLQTSSALTQLAIVDEKGNRLYTGLARDPPPINVSTRAHFTAQRDATNIGLFNNGLFVGPPSLSDIRGQHAIPISRRINGANGTFAGIITGAMEAEYFTNIYRATTRRQRVSIQLTLLDGTILLREPSTTEVSGASAASSTLFKEHLPKAWEGTFTAVGSDDGVERILSYKKVTGLPLVLAVAMARTDALIEWRQTLWLALAFSVPLLGAIVAGSWLLVAQIRERARRQQEQEVAQERLRQAQKQQALGTLVGGIAHEINSALVPIMMLGEMTEEALPEGSFERDSVAQMRQSADQIEKLIKRVLSFSRDEQASGQRLDLGDFVARLLVSLRPGLAVNIALVERVEPGIGAVLVGEEKLAQVFTDLVSNAAHAIGESSGRIEIAAVRAFDHDAEPEADRPENRGDFIRLSVTDDGPGIPPVVRERLFEPFFTTREAGQGVGLGLYTARRVITELGGYLDVDSTPGKGACFSITLPRAPAPALAAASAEGDR